MLPEMWFFHGLQFKGEDVRLNTLPRLALISALVDGSGEPAQAGKRGDHTNQSVNHLWLASSLITGNGRECSMARSRNTILEALAQISNSELLSEHILDFFREVGAVDNHRGAALLLATQLEDALQFALINRLKIDHKRFNDIFGYDASMGTFDRKVRVAHAIGMITDETRLTLDVIRRVRNAFAHSLIPISFNTPGRKCVLTFEGTMLIRLTPKHTVGSLAAETRCRHACRCLAPCGSALSGFTARVPTPLS